MNRTPFSPSEEKYLRENFGKIASRKLAQHLKCSSTKVQKFFLKNNMKFRTDEINRMRSKTLKEKTAFLPWQNQFLKDNYLEMPVKRIAKEIGRSYGSVNKRLSQMGLVNLDEKNNVYEEKYSFSKSVYNVTPGKVIVKIGNNEFNRQFQQWIEN